MNNSPTDILAKYIEGKDEGKYQILEDIYAPDAVVEFDIRPQSISFPNEILGNDEIAKVLSADFIKKYAHVRTYYFSTSELAQENITKKKWLVVMKEISSERTRVGTGYYDLDFTNACGTLKIEKHKIYIHEMLDLTDKSSIMLNDIQRKLDYPCVDTEQFMDATSSYSELDCIRKYIVE